MQGCYATRASESCSHGCIEFDDQGATSATAIVDYARAKAVSDALLPSHDPHKIQPWAKGISALSTSKGRQRLLSKRA
jgi:hypothetical protein